MVASTGVTGRPGGVGKFNYFSGSVGMTINFIYGIFGFLCAGGGTKNVNVGHFHGFVSHFAGS
jgi:hypothetical protein